MAAAVANGHDEVATSGIVEGMKTVNIGESSGRAKGNPDRSADTNDDNDATIVLARTVQTLPSSLPSVQKSSVDKRRSTSVPLAT